MNRRTILLAGLAGACASAPDEPPAFSPSPQDVGARAAGAFLARPEFMRYRTPDVYAVHYAEAATAYGAAKFAAARGDFSLRERVAARHQRLLAEYPDNTANHVDVNVYGVWPLELSLRNGDADLRARGLALADGQWATLGDDGLTSQARYWIDDVWMIGALQVQAWRATGDPIYLNRAAGMAKAYIARLQQPNGLFHHGPNAHFFWGRGNGWVAAGLAEILSELPWEHADFQPIALGYQRMMAALLTRQAEDGMWRQLIDYPTSWKETSCTAMFGFAMATGVRKGLLTDGAYVAAYRRAWPALSAYVNEAGELSSVCVGTGQAQDENYYLTRPTVTGDLHGQAPLIWFATALLD